MHFFKVEIAVEMEGDPESYTVFLQSENVDLTQKTVEDYILRLIETGCHDAWCRVLYTSLLESLKNAEEEHHEPMSLLGGTHTTSSHPVWFGHGKRFRGTIEFRRLKFDTV